MAHVTTVADIPDEMREAGWALHDFLRENEADNYLGLYWAQTYDGAWRLHMITKLGGEIGPIAALSELLKKYPRNAEDDSTVSPMHFLIQSVSPNDRSAKYMYETYGEVKGDPRTLRRISFDADEYVYFLKRNTEPANAPQN